MEWWRDGPSVSDQLRETLCYFMDLYLTRLPLLGGLIIRTLSSNGLGGFPICQPEGFVGVQFPALVVIDMLLVAVGAFRAGLTRCLGWIDDEERNRCLCRGRGKELLEHRHHVLHLLSILCLEHVRHLGNHHGLHRGIQDFIFHHLVCNAFSDGSGGRSVSFHHLGELNLNVRPEVWKDLVSQKFGMPFAHCGVKLTRGLVS